MPRLPPAGSHPVLTGQAARAGGRHAGTRGRDTDARVRAGAQVASPRGALHRQVRHHHQLASGLLD